MDGLIVPPGGPGPVSADSQVSSDRAHGDEGGKIARGLAWVYLLESLEKLIEARLAQAGDELPAVVGIESPLRDLAGV
ncbi:MAG: hypothetical protein DMF53_17175 [Acidobacteria bacterium]|nr:MAG: hypothetical protein DMF53_17175 [Acidobacteriota bacterium]